MASAPHASQLSIRVLGELQVTRGGEHLALPPSKKTRALLAYLVLTQRAHRRERLCSLLWDVTDDPRGALRWSVSKLRALCNDAGATRIVADRDNVSFALHGAVVDALELRARAASGFERETFESLEELAHQFRGELLAGLSLGDFDEFQGWCVAEREQARQLQQELLRALLNRSPSAERALPHARALVHLDPLCQSSRASLVTLLSQLGLRQEAEVQYQSGRRLLLELGARDLDELEQAWRRTRSAPPAKLSLEAAVTAPPVMARTSAPASGPVSAPASARYASPFVGRHEECQRLGRALAEVARGRGQVLLMSGEAGVGKTRMLQELLAKARQAGSTVLTASAYEVESRRPFGPWIDALRQVPRPAVGSRLAEQLSVLLPEWGAEALAPQGEEQLFGAVSELLAARAHSAPPVVLGLDDAHWLDDASSRLLHYVARMQRHRPVLVVATARDGELFDNPTLLRALRSLRREGLLHDLGVGPLGPEDIAELARHLDPSADAERLFAESAGNPLFAIELSRAPRAAGDIPASLSETIRERVEALPTDAASVLRWAAVLGPHFEVARLEGVAQSPPDVLAVSLELLQRRALLQLDTDRKRGDTCTFSHDIVRRAVYADLSEPRRRLMHRRIAEHLAPLSERDDRVAVEVVHHASLAAQPEVAVRACLKAAEHCVRLYASKAAEALTRRGFYHVKQLPTAERTALEVELWRVQLAARRPENGSEAAAELQRLGELSLDLGAASAAHQAFHLLSWLRWEEGAWLDAMRSSLRAERVSRDLSEPAHITAMAEYARCLAMVEGDLGEAEALLLEARARSERSGFVPMVIPDALGMLCWHRGELQEAALLFARAHELARHESDRGNEFQALEHRSCVLYELADAGGARAVVQELGALGEKLRGGSEAPVASALARLLDYALQQPQAAAALEAAIEQLRRTDAKQRLAYVLLESAELDLARGEHGLASQRAREALVAASALSRRSDVARAHALLTLTALQEGDASRHAAEIKTLLSTPLAPLSARARRAVEKAMGDALPSPALPPPSKGKTAHGARNRRTSPG